MYTWAVWQRSEKRRGARCAVLRCAAHRTAHAFAARVIQAKDNSGARRSSAASGGPAPAPGRHVRIYEMQLDAPAPQNGAGRGAAPQKVIAVPPVVCSGQSGRRLARQRQHGRWRRGRHPPHLGVGWAVTWSAWRGCCVGRCSGAAAAPSADGPSVRHPHNVQVLGPLLLQHTEGGGDSSGQRWRHSATTPASALLPCCAQCCYILLDALARTAPQLPGAAARRSSIPPGPRPPPRPGSQHAP